MPRPSASSRRTTFNVVQLRTRRPTGKPGWPRMLLSGDEGSGKSWTLAQMSADERLGEMLWFEIGAGEQTADEYGAIPGARYQIVEHDGTFADIYHQLCAAWDYAKGVEERGEPPIPLAWDSMTGLWQMLCAWGDLVARRREAKKLTRNDEHADTSRVYSPEYLAQMAPDIWNLVNRRWNMIMTKLLTWPGPVAYTAREKLVTPFDEKGNPDAKAPKEWTLEAQKGLGYASTVWVRLTRDTNPKLVKLRSVREGVAVEADPKKPRPIPGARLNLPHLVFDVIGCEAGTTRAPEHRDLNADQVMPGEESPEDLRRAAEAEAGRTWVTRTLAATTPEDAAARVSYLTTNDVGTQPALPYLDEDVRDGLGIGPDIEALTLLELAQRHGAYIAKHGRSVLAALDAEAGDEGDTPRAIEAGPAETAADVPAA